MPVARSAQALKRFAARGFFRFSKRQRRQWAISRAAGRAFRCSRYLPSIQQNPGRALLLGTAGQAPANRQRERSLCQKRRIPCSRLYLETTPGNSPCVFLSRKSFSGNCSARRYIFTEALKGEPVRPICIVRNTHSWETPALQTCMPVFLEVSGLRGGDLSSVFGNYPDRAAGA